jgi:hypothetical protein
MRIVLLATVLALAGPALAGEPTMPTTVRIERYGDTIYGHTSDGRSWSETTHNGVKYGRDDAGHEWTIERTPLAGPLPEAGG